MSTAKPYTPIMGKSPDEDERFGVSAFLGRRSHRFRVQWDTGECTWEPEKTLRQDLGKDAYDRLVKEYYNTKEEAKKKPLKKPTKKKASSMSSVPSSTKKKPRTKKHAKKLFKTKNDSDTCYKPVINQAIAMLAHKYKATSAFVVDDPSSTVPMQTTNVLREYVPGIDITAVSCDPKINTFKADFAKHNDQLVCGMTTTFLESQLDEDGVYIGKRYNMMFLDYCDTPSRLGKKYDWMRDVQLAMDHFLAPKGMLHLTFSSRGFGHIHTFVHFALDEYVPSAQIVAPYDYRDTQNMVVFTLVRKGDWPSSRPPLSIGRAIIPRPEEEVLVQADNGEVWKGTFVGMLNSKQWSIYCPVKQICYDNIDKDMVRPARMTI